MPRIFNSLKNRMMHLLSIYTYIAPEMEAMELISQEVLCTSGGTEQYGDNNTDPWFQGM